MPPVAAVHRHRRRSLALVPVFCVYFYPLYPSWSSSISLSISGKAARAFRFLSPTCFSPSAELARSSRNSPHPPFPTDPPLTPRQASTGLQNRQSPLLTQPSPSRRSFSDNHPFGLSCSLREWSLASPAAPKREQRWRKTKQLGEGARKLSLALLSRRN